MYQVYTVPAVGGASIQLGAAPPTPIQPNDQRFCTLTDAQVILKVFTDLGVPDIALVDASEATVNGVHFLGVDPGSLARPWYVVSSTVTGPVGPALWVMYGPNNINGGGRGNPGAWTGVLSGNPQWVPVAPAVAPLTVVPVNTSGDPAAFAGAVNVPSLIFSQADRDAINNTQRLVIALGKACNIT